MAARGVAGSGAGAGLGGAEGGRGQPLPEASKPLELFGAREKRDLGGEEAARLSGEALREALEAEAPARAAELRAAGTDAGESEMRAALAEARALDAAACKEAGNEALAAGDADAALAHYQAAIALAPSRADLYCNAAAALLQLDGRASEALSLAQVRRPRQPLPHSPAPSPRPTFLSRTLFVLSCHGHARAQEAKQRDPQSGKACFREAQAFEALGQDGDAAASFWEAFRLDPASQAAERRFPPAHWEALKHRLSRLLPPRPRAPSGLIAARGAAASMRLWTGPRRATHASRAGARAARA